MFGIGRANDKEVNSYPDLYNLALRLPDETLGIALRRLHYPIPKSHEEKAKLYARYYSSGEGGRIYKSSNIIGSGRGEARKKEISYLHFSSNITPLP